jgi:hypothetical protein
MAHRDEVQQQPGAEAGAPAPAAPLTTAETERVRRRVRLMIQITSRIGTYRAGLTSAAKHLTPEEAAIVADLERHGLDVPQLREILCGGHVLVDEPELYETWRFPHSRERLSSHHKTVDKKEFPDLGLKGPIVREKLHGRTAAGTWVQLEKTPAAMGHGFRLPTLTDLMHLWDYVVYRVTKSNVGPWGLSKNTERRPMYLSPSLGTKVPLPASAEEELLGALARVEEDDDTSSASPDLAARFPPPDRANDLAELALEQGSRAGRGLFGSSDVLVSERPSTVTREVLAESDDERRWQLPQARATATVTLRAGDRELRCAARRVPVEEQKERT